MKICFTLILYVGLTISCTKAQMNNPELQKMYEDDQAARKQDKIDWTIISKADSLRERRVYKLIDSKLLNIGIDYKNAAMIFQHGNDSISYKMAVKMMTKAVELDPNIDKWLLAAATDRYLVSIGKPQIYGTQYYKNKWEDPWKMNDLDTTKVTDEERRKFNVPTLAEQKLKLLEMNMSLKN